MVDFSDRIVYFRDQETGGLVSLLSSEVDSLEEETELRKANGDYPVGPPTPVFSTGNVVRARSFRAGYWPALPIDYFSFVFSEEILCTVPSSNQDPDAPTPYTLDGFGTSTFASTDVLVMGYSYYLVEGCLVHSTWVKILAVYSQYGLVVQRHSVWQLPEGWQSPDYLPACRSLQDSLYPYSTDVVEFFQLHLEKKKLYLGLEWEANLSFSTNQTDLFKWFDQLIQDREAIPTKDSTVDVEIKLSPMTPSDLCSFLKKHKDWFEQLVYGDDVGAHLHVSKSAFYNEQAQACFVISVTDDAGQDYGNLFGSPSPFAQVLPKTTSNWKSQTKKEAVNTLNPNTLEVRAFRGTGDISIIMARVEYLVKKINESNRLALMR